MRRVRTWAPVVAVFIFLGVFVVPRLAGWRINTSSSMPRGLYRAVGTDIRRGAIVAACLPGEIARFGLERNYLHPGSCPDGVEPVAKVVAGLEGNVVEVTRDGVFVDGVMLPHSQPLGRDRGGRTLQQFPGGAHRLEKGQAWLYSPYEARSWDSRYYGPVPTANVLFVVEPVLTIP